jgi:hypothetical protein
MRTLKNKTLKQHSKIMKKKHSRIDKKKNIKEHELNVVKVEKEMKKLQRMSSSNAS